MKSRIIFSQENNKRVILIFAGWSTNPSFYRHLKADGWDIALVWDYYSLDFDPSFLDKYSTIFVVAWSMGVAAAAHAAATSLSAERISAAFAINGTLYPCSDSYGIPEAIYEGTRLNLTPKNLLKFTKRMGYVPPKNLPAPLKEDFYIPDFEALAVELENMKTSSLKGNLPWKRVYISLNDRIFPAASMEAAWRLITPTPEIIRLEAEHYVNLQRVIDDITPDLKGIAKHFGEALTSYEAEAVAQHQVVEKLMNILSETDCSNIHSMLEIGTGSGLFSRKLLSSLPLTSATFIDLYPIPPFNKIAVEKYVVEDAEKWMEGSEPDSFDIIASASTIQWFADPDRFFKNSSHALRHGGILLCSTYLPGNLKNLTEGKSTLLYRSKEELERSLRKYFKDISTFESPITLDFPSRRDMLMHLKKTGVAGGKHSLLPFDERQKPDRTDTRLTFLPFYILARK